jgi:hypothetical protein
MTARANYAVEYFLGLSQLVFVLAHYSGFAPMPWYVMMLPTALYICITALLLMLVGAVVFFGEKGE